MFSGKTKRRWLALFIAGAMAASSTAVWATDLKTSEDASADGKVNSQTAANYITDDNFSNDMIDNNYTKVSQSMTSPVM